MQVITYHPEGRNDSGFLFSFLLPSSRPNLPDRSGIRRQPTWSRKPCRTPERHRWWSPSCPSRQTFFVFLKKYLSKLNSFLSTFSDDLSTAAAALSLLTHVSNVFRVLLSLDICCTLPLLLSLPQFFFHFCICWVDPTVNSWLVRYVTLRREEAAAN